MGFLIIRLLQEKPSTTKFSFVILDPRHLIIIIKWRGSNITKENFVVESFSWRSRIIRNPIYLLRYKKQWLYNFNILVGFFYHHKSSILPHSKLGQKTYMISGICINNPLDTNFAPLCFI